MIAIITARGGSKRIPNKNIKAFCGKPVIAYSIQAALQCGLFDEVMVSTDSEAIAEISRGLGANVPFYRSAKNADDYATTADVLVEVLQEYEKRGKTYRHGCCLYPAAPFVTAQKLTKAYQMFANSGAKSLVPVVSYSYPPLRSLKIENGYLVMNWPEYDTYRSQDLPPIYHDCGQFYFFDVAAMKEKRSLFLPDILPFITPELEVQDIDTEADWQLAELKYKLWQEELKG